MLWRKASGELASPPANDNGVSVSECGEGNVCDPKDTSVIPKPYRAEPEFEEGKIVCIVVVVGTAETRGAQCMYETHVHVAPP